MKNEEWSKKVKQWGGQATRPEKRILLKTKMGSEKTNDKSEEMASGQRDGEGA